MSKAIRRLTIRLFTPILSTSYPERKKRNVARWNRDTIRGGDSRDHSKAEMRATPKSIARLSLPGRLRVDRLPIGALADKMKKHLPDSLHNDLKWLSSGVANFAKHDYDLSDRDEPEPEHSFELDEAIAVYLICRRLAVELEKLGGKSKAALSSETGY